MKSSSQDACPISASERNIAIAVDLSDESGFAVQWTVQNYLRTGDSVTLLHVRPTSVLFGADWGSIERFGNANEESQKKIEADFDLFTTKKVDDLSKSLVEAKIPFKIHMVKDHDMKERLCLEVERLRSSVVIMGSRGFGASKTESKRALGSVSNYCVQHCVCPIIVVRYPYEKVDRPENLVEESEDGDDSEEHGGSKEEHSDSKES